MADLMNPGGRLTKAKLPLANANPSDVSSGKSFYSNGNKELQTGALVERGTSQYAGGIGSGGSGSSAYIALNKIPEGIYRSNGESWAPEIRIDRLELVSYLNAKPGFVVGGQGHRHASYVNPSVFSGASSAGNIKSPMTITLTARNSGMYLICGADYTESGSHSSYFQVRGQKYHDTTSLAIQLNAGEQIIVHHSCSNGDWSVYGCGIAFVG